MCAKAVTADEQYRLIMECRASGLTNYSLRLMIPNQILIWFIQEQLMLHKNRPRLLFHLNKAGISFLLRSRRNLSGFWCHGGYIQIPFLSPAPAAAVYSLYLDSTGLMEEGVCVVSTDEMTEVQALEHRYPMYSTPAMDDFS